MNNNIGILTYQNTSNFGAVLQTYGLYAYLRKNGYSCKIINYISNAIDVRENPQNMFYELRQCGSLKSKLFMLLSRKKRIAKYNGLKSFLVKNGALSMEYSISDISLTNQEFDTFLVGSDMVWNFNINSNDFTFLLDFVHEDKKKCSYASSVGEEWSDSIDTNVKRLFGRFDNISIREEQFRTYLEQKTNKNINVVCDPTMLLSADEWGKYAAKPLYENYVLVYFNTSDSKCLKDAVKYAKNHCCRVKYISLGVRKNPEYDLIWPTSIEQFLSLVKNAKAVFTASYHGLLFSAYFETELFWYSRAQNSRMKYITDRLGLERRCGSALELSEMPEINYETLRILMAEFRSYSEALLHSFLEK